MKPVHEPEYNKAKSLLRNNNPADALPVIEERIRHSGETPEYLLLQGVAIYLLGRYEKALSILLDVYKTEHEKFKTAYYMGLCMEKKNDFENALKYFRISGNLRPDYIPVKNKLNEYGVKIKEEDNMRDRGVFTRIKNYLISFT